MTRGDSRANCENCELEFPVTDLVEVYLRQPNEDERWFCHLCAIGVHERLWEAANLDEHESDS